jgi:hypothetical protein
MLSYCVPKPYIPAAPLKNWKCKLEDGIGSNLNRSPWKNGSANQKKEEAANLMELRVFGAGGVWRARRRQGLRVRLSGAHRSQRSKPRGGGGLTGRSGRWWIDIGVDWGGNATRRHSTAGGNNKRPGRRQRWRCLEKEEEDESGPRPMTPRVYASSSHCKEQCTGGPPGLGELL